MTEAIVWGVIWAILTFGGTWVLYAVIALGGGALAVATDKLWLAAIFIPAAWIAALAWFVFGAVQTILQIISIVHIATGS